MATHIYTCDKVGNRYPQEESEGASLQERIKRRIWATRHLRQTEHGDFETDHAPTLVDLAYLRGREDALREVLMLLAPEEPKKGGKRE